MVTMLSIMKDTDDHFAQVKEQLDIITKKIEPGKLKVVKTVD